MPTAMILTANSSDPIIRAFNSLHPQLLPNHNENVALMLFYQPAGTHPQKPPLNEITHLITSSPIPKNNWKTKQENQTGAMGKPNRGHAPDQGTNRDGVIDGRPPV